MTKTDFRLGKAEMKSWTTLEFMAAIAEPMMSPSWQGEGMLAEDCDPKKAGVTDARQTAGIEKEDCWMTPL